MVNVSNKDKSITKPTPFEIFFYVNCSCPSPEGMKSLTIWVAEYIPLQCNEEPEDLNCRLHPLSGGAN